jgi:hypothetical protein
MQGIRWYSGNGVLPEDRLATTFEAFVDVTWVRQFAPIMMFNQVGRIGERTVDFDTLLEMQARFAEEDERSVVPMPEESLVHPSQMIHQFTMVRRLPGAALPVFSLPMIPFLEWLSGVPDAIVRASDRIDRARDRIVPLWDGIEVNFALLSTASVDWCLKQMLMICEARGVDPGRSLYDYGVRLYRLCGAAQAEVWKGDFRPDQRRWIASFAQLTPLGLAPVSRQ